MNSIRFDSRGGPLSARGRRASSTANVDWSGPPAGHGEATRAGGVYPAARAVNEAVTVASPRGFPPVPTAREPGKSLAGQVFESNLGPGSQFPEGVLHPSPSSQHTTPGEVCRMPAGEWGLLAREPWEPAGERDTDQQKPWKKACPARPARFPRFPPAALADPLPPAG
jgi:hypothetical protein